jgi:hypothetical protein
VSLLMLFCTLHCAINRNISNKTSKQSLYPIIKVYADKLSLTYKSNIKAGLDTITLTPTSFQVFLPKKLQYYDIENSSDFGFYYTEDEVIFIRTYYDKKRDVQDTIYTPQRKNWII